MSEQKKYCHKCNTEMKPTGRVDVSKDNPEPYPQGSLRNYECPNPNCGVKLIDATIEERNRFPR